MVLLGLAPSAETEAEPAFDLRQARAPAHVRGIGGTWNYCRMSFGGRGL